MRIISIQTLIYATAIKFIYVSAINFEPRLPYSSFNLSSPFVCVGILFLANKKKLRPICYSSCGKDSQICKPSIFCRSAVNIQGDFCSGLHIVGNCQLYFTDNNRSKTTEMRQMTSSGILGTSNFRKRKKMAPPKMHVVA